MARIGYYYSDRQSKIVRTNVIKEGSLPSLHETQGHKDILKTMRTHSEVRLCNVSFWLQNRRRGSLKIQLKGEDLHEENPKPLVIAER